MPPNIPLTKHITGQTKHSLFRLEHLYLRLVQPCRLMHSLKFACLRDAQCVDALLSLTISIENRLSGELELGRLEAVAERALLILANQEISV